MDKPNKPNDLSKNRLATPAKIFFSKPAKWQLGVLNILLTILMPLLLNTPDIYLNIYIIKVMF
ncbi:hypothetical protein ES754_10300 [Psychrobacter frigidicola]|uniref:Uncharacterized protein n=1 Tax=Psychrobacter frigidicola TaxID=45611 RepID=A0A5C7A1F8_9GAMM|nr:hypothetical protein [Psychrobacter frigidicola]TXD96519.1 hypothetical protein ES754_10300 [Psychrobacter frigidicola]